ncbi:flagellar protein FliT [Paenibacillus tengchongensis]|uniref:flagellar protein FliT n=1 Tax=Paenibacillus tengchongensis TaxID=2608684 RepID=UPI001C9E88ED|nr:flagellar protein FliT [Paenibacillus tengchongensis]
MLKELEQLTEKITGSLMELTYEELESFVAERQKLVEAIGREVENVHPTAAHKETLRRILEQDPAIVARMNGFRLEAQDWLHKRNQAKTQRSAYESAYTPDSILMDRRK